MQGFSALLGSQAAGASSSSRTASNTGGTQEGATDPGGFDRLMQSQSRDDAGAQERERTADAAGTRRADEAGKRDAGRQDPGSAKTQESRAEDGARRAEAKDTESPPRDAAADETVDAETASEAPPATTAGAAPAEAVAPASPVSLPEQLLALLNGLAASPAGTPPTDIAAPTLPTDAPAPSATGAAKPLPAMQPQALAGAATPAANDADAAAFALATNAATAGAADAGADLADTTTPIGEAEPSGQAAPLPGLSTISSPPLSRAAAAAVQANPPLSVDGGFEDAFGSRIAWLADQKVGHAEIRVTPDHLGTIDVRLQLDGNRVNAEFNSAQADVRHALESSLPRLREMLGQQGLQLGQADVGQRQPQQQAPNGQSAASPGAERGDIASDAAWTPGPAVRATRGLLDEYA
ncbi:MAG TPA: flagellar hook-length control protein FliK [Lysobacter sp.]